MMASRLNGNRLRGGTLCNNRGILIDSHKLKIFELKPEVIDRFKNQVAVLVADMAKLRSRYSDKHYLAHGVTEASRFEPGFVGMPVNFLFQGAENAHPWIHLSCCGR